MSTLSVELTRPSRVATLASAAGTGARAFVERHEAVRFGPQSRRARRASRAAGYLRPSSAWMAFFR